MIEVSNLTLTYPSGKGVFDLDFTIEDGKVTGYLGPNGAGKTTTIRALLGFMKPDSGQSTINGRDCWRNAPEIQQTLGYIPGEISFPDKMRGDEYLRFMHQMRGGRPNGAARREKELLKRFELQPAGRINKFSKGMKQKLGIVAAFMHDPQVLILDEPTSGLDPLMQNRFVELIREERGRGKTILMSSHSFEEVEKTCDHVLIIREGRMIHQAAADELKSTRQRRYLLRAADSSAAEDALSSAGFVFSREIGGSLDVTVPGRAIDRFIKLAAGLEIIDLDARNQTLEELFMKYYGQDSGEGQS